MEEVRQGVDAERGRALARPSRSVGGALELRVRAHALTHAHARKKDIFIIIFS